MLKPVAALMILPAVALMAFAVLTTGTEDASARSVKIHERTIEVTTFQNQFFVEGKASGLAGGFTYRVEVEGQLTGTGQCRNPGGNDPPPQTFTANVAGSGEFTAQRNGNMIFTVMVGVPSPTGACPNPNWTANVLSYSGTVNVSIWDGNTLLAMVTGVPVSFP